LAEVGTPNVTPSRASVASLVISLILAGFRSPMYEVVKVAVEVKVGVVGVTPIH
jgi:hypothetical protein